MTTAPHEGILALHNVFAAQVKYPWLLPAEDWRLSRHDDAIWQGAIMTHHNAILRGQRVCPISGTCRYTLIAANAAILSARQALFNPGGIP